MAENKSASRHRQLHGLKNLEVSSVILVTRPGIDVGFLILKRHAPNEQQVPTTKENIEHGEVV